MRWRTAKRLNRRRRRPLGAAVAQPAPHAGLTLLKVMGLNNQLAAMLSAAASALKVADADKITPGRASKKCAVPHCRRAKAGGVVASVAPLLGPVPLQYQTTPPGTADQRRGLVPARCEPAPNRCRQGQANAKWRPDPATKRGQRCGAPPPAGSSRAKLLASRSAPVGSVASGADRPNGISK